MIGSLVLALLSAGAAALYATMLEGPLRVIRAEADGLKPLDLRFGYGAAEVRAFLRALSPEGRALYLGRQRRLDAVFMVLLAAALIVAAFVLTPPPYSYLFAAAGVLGACADAVENVRVVRLLQRDPAQIGDAEVRAASLATRLKFVLTGVVLVGIPLQMIFGSGA